MSSSSSRLVVGLSRVWLSLGLVFALTATLLMGSPAPAGAVAGYGDVPEGSWYTDAVQWSADNAITDIAGVCFAPETPVSRGETAVWIYNMENQPDAGEPHSFIDVTDASQDDAISWMANNEITTGTSPTTFAPDETLRRAQVAAFLHRLKGEPPAPPHGFVDVVAAWQQDAVSWMAHSGITTGTTPTTFAPEDTLTRAQLITFLYRYKNKPDVTVNTSTPHCDPTTDTPENPTDTPTLATDPAISISDTHGCKLSADGQLACWGNDTHGQASPPPGTYTDIAVSTNYSCAIRSDGRVACWGDNTDGRTTPPAGQYTDVTASTVHPCAVRSDRTIVCWGDSHVSYSGGGSTDRPPTGTFTDISLSYRAGCGITTDQSIQCWGWTAVSGIGPSPQGTFTTVDVHRARACALRTDSTITCWGRGSAVVVEEAPAGSHIAISSGGYTGSPFSCALRTDLTIACWGADTVTLPYRLDEQPTTIVGLTNPPTGRYRAIALTHYQACALRDDNTHTCWGGPARPLDETNAQLVMDFLKANIIDRYGLEHPWLQEVWNYALDSGVDFKIEPIRFATGSPSRGDTNEHIEWRRLRKADVADGAPIPYFDDDDDLTSYSSAVGFVIPDTTFLSADYVPRFVRELAHIYVESINVLDDPTPIAVAQVHFHSHRNLWNDRKNDCYPIGLIVDIMVQQIAPGETMQWWQDCATLADHPDSESINVVQQALTGQQPAFLAAEYFSPSRQLDYGRIWGCAVYFHCERFTAQFIAPYNLIYQLRYAFGGYCSSDHVENLIDFRFELSILQPWRDGGCGDASPTTTPGFLTASNRLSRWYKSAADRYSAEHPWLATAWEQTNRSDYVYHPSLSPYGAITCRVAAHCVLSGRAISGAIGAYPGVISFHRPPTSEPEFWDLENFIAQDDIVVHELTHDITLRPYDIPQAPTIAIGMLYFQSLHLMLEPQTARTIWCAPHELFAQAAEELVFQRNPRTAFSACTDLNSHSSEAVAVTRDALNGVMPDWFYTEFGNTDGGIDYVELWESVKEAGKGTPGQHPQGDTLVRQLQHAFGGYCFDLESVRYASTYNGIELPENAPQPWADGGCNSVEIGTEQQDP